MLTLNLTKPIAKDRSPELIEASKLLQERLTAKGWDLVIDGIPGKKTKAALIQFQAANGLTPDAVCGPKTWEKLLTVKYKGGAEFQSRHASAMGLGVRQMLAGIEAAAGNVADPRAVAAVRLAVTDWYGVEEVPDGSNTGPELAALVEGYNEYWKITDGKMRPWCAIAVSQWIRLSLDVVWSDTPMEHWFGGVAQYEAWANERGVFLPTGKDRRVEPGEIFTMGRGGSGSDPSQTVKAGHCGLVLWDHGDGRVETIEGNTSNEVLRNTRKKSELRGFIPWWRA